MKARINLSVDKQLLAAMKKYADRNDIAISKLVSNYFIEILNQSPRKHTTIIDLVEKLEKPIIKTGANLKELYYKEQGNQR